MSMYENDMWEMCLPLTCCCCWCCFFSSGTTKLHLSGEKLGVGVGGGDKATVVPLLGMLLFPEDKFLVGLLGLMMLPKTKVKRNTLLISWKKEIKKAKQFFIT